MALLTSKSSRFARSMNYTMPEYRPNSARTASNRLSVVAPLGHAPNREAQVRRKENGEG